MTRVTLASYIADNATKLPIDQVLQKVGVRNLNPAVLADTSTIVELDDDGDVIAVHKPTVIPVPLKETKPSPPAEPEVAENPPEVEEPKAEEGPSRPRRGRPPKIQRD